MNTMVKINEYEKEGETKKSIKLSGMGEEEEVVLTVRSDKVWKSDNEIKGEKDGRKYSFKPMGIGAVYHKDGTDHDVWVNLTERQAKNLEELNFQSGDKVIAMKMKSKAGRDFVTFKREGAIDLIKPEVVIDGNEFEINLLKECVRAGMNDPENQEHVDCVVKNFNNFKTVVDKSECTDFDAASAIHRLLKEGYLEVE